MQRSDGGGAFLAVDRLNGRLLCGCDDVHACMVRRLLLWLVGKQTLRVHLVRGITISFYNELVFIENRIALE